MAIGANDIKNNGVKVEKINSAVLGGDVYIKELTILEDSILDDYRFDFLDFDEKGKTIIKNSKEARKAYGFFILYSVGMSLCDEKGERLFKNIEEIEGGLGNKKGAEIIALHQEIEALWSSKKKN